MSDIREGQMWVRDGLKREVVLVEDGIHGQQVKWRRPGSMRCSWCAMSTFRQWRNKAARCWE